MADTHEEQLLSDLLSAIAREDAGLDAPHLEARVLASVPMQVPERPRRSRVSILLPVAAAVFLAFAITVRIKPGTTTETARLKPDATTGTTTTATVSGATDVAIDKAPRARVRHKPSSTRTNDTAGDVRVADRETPASAAPVAASPLATPAIEFVPLMPITEHELTGSFQIVRVQMPSASLGALRSPLARPNEMVEADVLLGEDGRARAIRVNANESIYPWRPR